MRKEQETRLQKQIAKQREEKVYIKDKKKIYNF